MEMQFHSSCEAIQSIAMDWIASPRNSYVEAPSPKAAGFRDNAGKEVIKSRWSYKGGAVIAED